MNDFSIPWPAFAAAMWSTSESSSSIPASTSFVSCAISLGFYSRLMIMVTAPLAVSVVLLVIPLYTWIRKKVADWTSYRTACLVVIYLLYPSVCREVVRVLDCSSPIDGVRYLEADYREPCGSAEHLVHVVIGVLVIILFCIGFPAFTGFVLRSRHQQGRLDDLDTRKQVRPNTMRAARVCDLFVSNHTHAGCWWHHSYSSCSKATSRIDAGGRASSSFASSRWQQLALHWEARGVVTRHTLPFWC